MNGLLVINYMNKIPVTVIVPVKNEEKNLPNFLPLLKDFDEVIVIDSNSTDGTQEIVESFGYQLFEFTWNGHFPKKRNWALRNIPSKNEWVFFVDADEYMTDVFLDNLKATMIETKDYVGFRINYKNVFMGKLIKYGDPISKLALFKKSAGEYEKIEDDDTSGNYSGLEIHEHPVLNGSVGEIKGYILHKENRGITSYIQKHNEYSSWEARRFLKIKKNIRERLTFRQKVKYALIDSWWFGNLYFIYYYIWKCGFLDGKEGYILATLKKQYFANVKCKIEELRLQSK